MYTQYVCESFSHLSREAQDAGLLNWARRKIGQVGFLL